MRLRALTVMVIFVLAAAGAIYQGPMPAGEPAQDILRLHILAHSDDPEEQELKLLVRDAVLSVLTPAMCRVTSREEAASRVLAHLKEAADAAQKALERRGKDYPLILNLGQSYFPDRSYGSTFLPAGQYQALQIIIGDGSGANWWCVLFPPLCLVEGTSAKAAEGEEEELVLEGEEEESISSTPEIRFKIVEWWQKLRE